MTVLAGWQEGYLSMCNNGHFPGEPGLAGPVEAKDDGGGER